MIIYLHTHCVYNTPPVPKVLSPIVYTSDIFSVCSHFNKRSIHLVLKMAATNAVERTIKVNGLSIQSHNIPP